MLRTKTDTGWHIDAGDEWRQPRVLDWSGQVVAVLPEESDRASLIAAAPDMLAELKRDLQFAREMKGLIEALKGKRWVQHTMVLSRIEMLTVAIALAEGSAK